MSINSLDGVKPGDLYTTDGKDIWIVQSCCERPTITMRNVRTDQEQGGAVGSLIVRDFVKLIPDGKLTYKDAM